MNAVIAVALPVFALVLAGFLAGRAGVLGPDATNTLNRFVVWLALPALLFRVTASAHWNELFDVGFILAYGGGIMLTGIVSLAVTRAEPLVNGTIKALCANFANAGFMGLPLARLAFGDAALLPTIVTVLMTACLLFAVSIAIVEIDLHRGQGTRALTKVSSVLARNLLLVAPIAGALWSLTTLPLPAPADRFLDLLGAAATPCALAGLGLFVAERAGGFVWTEIMRLTALKLLFQPAATYLIAYHVVTLPPLWAATAVLISALPTGTGPFILAKMYDRDPSATSGTILVSTILSFATISALLVWLGAVR